jgi:hypothetical protein
MYKVTNPKTNKTYTYGMAKKEQAYDLAKRLGVEVKVVQPVYRKTCICGRPEESHESYDCYKDNKLTKWGI